VAPIEGALRPARTRSHWHKRYEPAQTAYQRLMRSSKLPRKQRRELRDRFESRDPFALKQDVEKRLKKILGGADVVSRPSGGSAPRRGCGRAVLRFAFRNWTPRSACC
jgi:hypothetical protein